MTPEKEDRLQTLLHELAELLFEEADASQLTDLEGLERELRRLGQEHLFPALAAFFVTRVVGAPTGHPRRVNTVLGTWTLSSEQARRLQMPSHRQMSPLLEKCVLVAAAKTSFAQAEKDLWLLCGVRVSDSTVRRLALQTNSWSCAVPAAASADAAAAVPAAVANTASLLCVDGGMVRLEGEAGGTQWRQYKALCLDGGQEGAEMLASLGQEEFLVQRLKGRCRRGVVCIGDGHDSVWNTVAALPLRARQEVLDWYHLKENVWKQPWDRARKEHIESLLWSGHLDQALQDINGAARRGSSCGGTLSGGTLSGYLEQHRRRIPQGGTSYAWRQQRGLPIGSGAVESAIKQIDARLQLPGAWWSAENVNPMLDLRCAYLNGWLYT